MNITSYPRTARLVNRFMLGADPEFVMSDAWGRYIYAETLGMTTLQGFGCDMAGRQAEVRAYPSRFALEVVASVMEALRWMALVHPESLECNWNAVAYNGKDGCGGHVHFGRRRPNRKSDIKVLDSVTDYLLESNVLDKEGFAQRQTGTHFGQHGDFRPQRHDYEYRTLPTQLSSPWLTYFTLVVSKLAVFSGVTPLIGPSSAFIDMLKQYEDRDDDAAIALQAIKQHGLPRQTRTDFKVNWGITRYLNLPKVAFDKFFFPSMFEPRRETCEDLFELLIHGKALPVRMPVPNWEPYALPNDVFKVGVQPHTLGHAPDVAMNLLSKGVKVRVNVHQADAIYTPIPLPKAKIRKAWGSQIHYREGREYDSIQLYLSTETNKSLERCRKAKAILSDPELFPVCKPDQLNKVDWSRWTSMNGKSTKPEPAKLGRVVAHVIGKPLEPKIPKSRYADEGDF